MRPSGPTPEEDWGLVNAESIPVHTTFHHLGILSDKKRHPIFKFLNEENQAATHAWGSGKDFELEIGKSELQA